MARLKLPSLWPHTVCAATLVLFPLITRAQLLWEKQLPFGVPDLHGVVADLSMALVAALVVLALSRLSRIAAAVAALAWVLLTFANYEHVHTFDAAVSTTLAKYLLDPTFFEGSALHATHPVLLAFALLGAIGPWVRRPKATPSRQVLGVAGGLAVVLLGVAIAWPVRAQHVAWRQSHFMLLAARSQLAAVVRAEPLGPSSPAVDALFRADLSGQPRFELPGKKRNVLLIFLESFPAAAIPRLAAHQGLKSEASAPKLDAFAQRAVVFDNFIAQQRQTNRGEYSVLCGDMPRQSSRQSRMTEYVQQGGTRTCLPKILRDAGYATVYLQAAPTAFMFKDQFMSQIGFERVLGTEFFTSSYARNRWGVDDRAFFEQAHGLITQLHQGEKPWFATLLTVGTHHPFLVPGGFRATGTPWARSVAYVDEALTVMLQKLEAEGVLDDTVVLVTGDESNGTLTGDDITRGVTQNWVPLLAFLPEKDLRGQIIDEPFMQSDLALSLLDYLGLADRREQLVGRSLFRTYSQRRPLYFANIHSNRLWAITPDNVLSGCNEHLEDCSSYRVDPVHPFNPRREELDWNRQRLADWSAVVARTDTVLQGSGGARTIALIPPGAVKVQDRSRPGQVIFAGQYLDVPKDTVIDVSFEVEARTDGLLSLTHDLWAPGHTFYSPALSVLGDGHRARVSYSYRFEELSKQVEIRLFSRPVQGNHHELLIHDAKMVLHPPSSATGEVGVQHPKVEIDRASPTRPQHFSTADFSHARCVTGGAQLRLRGCANGVLVFGPWAGAPKGSQVKARVELSLVGGEGDFQIEIATALGKNRLPGEHAHLQEGASAVLEASTIVTEETELIEARLVSSKQRGTDAIVRSMTLDIFPASPPHQAVLPGTAALAPQ
ncbi:MAG: LTA synthase family protein [Myxococcaceae bacterium]|nr:LTA synthase family protein [Myxococcaceae bacterium]